jgi:hypothetical protein
MVRWRQGAMGPALHPTSSSWRDAGCTRAGGGQAAALSHTQEAEDREECPKRANLVLGPPGRIDGDNFL